MPLILMVGYPSSGKSRWAQKLVDALENRISQLEPSDLGSNLKIKLYNDKNLGIKHEMYRESVSEKAIRGEQMSAVRRDLSKNRIVILDALNYIKGFRYQLYCEAKNLGTTYCVIQVIAPTDKCFQWNAARPESERWEENLIKALIMRFEEPNGLNRWDSPLIPVTFDDVELPFEEIWKSIVLKKPPKPNHATFMKAATPANSLQELDRMTSLVIDQIIQYQNLNQSGGIVLVKDNSGSTNTDQKCYVHLPPRVVTIAELQRMRRTYIALNRMRTIAVDRIITLFADFMDHAFNNND